MQVAFLRPRGRKGSGDRAVSQSSARPHGLDRAWPAPCIQTMFAECVLTLAAWELAEPFFLLKIGDFEIGF